MKINTKNTLILTKNLTIFKENIHETDMICEIKFLET